MVWYGRDHRERWEAVRREWTVYALCDPRDWMPRYVGITTNPKARLRGHLLRYPKAKAAWVGELRTAGVKPAIVRLAVLDGLHADARKAEAHWIELLKRQGCQLLNVARVKGAR